jgi:hypothetical protein
MMMTNRFACVRNAYVPLAQVKKALRGTSGSGSHSPHLLRKKGWRVG